MNGVFYADVLFISPGSQDKLVYPKCNMAVVTKGDHDAAMVELRRHVADLERVLARHTRWREKALRYLAMVRDRVPGWRPLVENFLEEATARLIQSELVPQKGV